MFDPFWARVNESGITVVAHAGDDVQVVAPQPLDHFRRTRGVIGRIAVGDDVDVRIDFGEHPAHDAALARTFLAAYDRAGGAGDVAGAIL